MRPLFEKEIDGFSVLFHQISYEKVGTSTIQSRACAGVAGGTYLFALPGSTARSDTAKHDIMAGDRTCARRDFSRARELYPDAIAELTSP